METKQKKNLWMDTVKGFVIGACMLVPGVSGGTLAIMFSVYDKLINSVASFTKNPKESFFFMVRFCIGGLLGVGIFAYPMKFILEHFPYVSLYFFLGAIIGSTPVLVKKAAVKKFDYKCILFPVIGVTAVLLLEQIPQDMLNMNGDKNLMFFVGLVIAGLVIAFALVMPGVSATHMLMILGLYEATLTAIYTLDIGFLLPLGASAVVCTLILAKVLDKAMKEYEQITFLLILGFVLGSVKTIYPGIPSGLDILLCIVTFILGFAAIYAVTNYKPKNNNETKEEQTV